MRPTDFERSFRFYTESLALHVYREGSSGSTRGMVFFLGGGFLYYYKRWFVEETQLRLGRALFVDQWKPIYGAEGTYFDRSYSGSQ